ncbi:MAG TPA: SRPBCC family protein [Candidatus Limnocylindria bacterium]|jgi:uncharacterized protein YndB with AHSA1/START domain|nr:SRPBCC family protein [Candidatus Limnocylindria bacterium]
MAPVVTEDTLTRELVVRVPPEQAFAGFVNLGRWWPREYTWSLDVLQSIGIEPRLGGACFERGPNGFECDWGRVLLWDPPRRIVFSWQIAFDRTPEPNPAKASEVEVRFSEDGLGTRVALEHRAFSRHGERAAAYRAGMASPSGWPMMLERFARSI